jgi:hypothetical protein
MKTFKQIREMMTTGAVAGIGAPPTSPEGKPANWSEPGVPVAVQRKRQKGNAESQETMTSNDNLLRRANPNG